MNFLLKQPALQLLFAATFFMALASMTLASERAEKTVKGAVVGAGVGALLGGSDGAKKGAVAGALIGNLKARK